MSDVTHTDDPKDGFDLIEFPTVYSFKAMCRVNSLNVPATEYVQGLVLQHVNQQQIQGLRSTLSRTGKFESVTISVKLPDRAMLEAIYQTLSDSPHVPMTL